MLNMEQWKAIFNAPREKEQISSQIENYVSRCVFEHAKYLVSNDMEKKMCLKAWREKRVVLPKKCCKIAYVTVFRERVHDRMKELRRNSVKCAGQKFMGK